MMLIRCWLPAVLVLGGCLTKPTPAPLLREKTDRWYFACATDDGEACWQLARYFLEEQQPDAAREYAERSCGFGSGDGCVMRARLCAVSVVSSPCAQKWLTLAVDAMSVEMERGKPERCFEAGMIAWGQLGQRPLFGQLLLKGCALGALNCCEEEAHNITEETGCTTGTIESVTKRLQTCEGLGGGDCRGLRAAVGVKCATHAALYEDGITHEPNESLSKRIRATACELGHEASCAQAK